MFIITISRQVGSLGDEVAQALARKLGWELITREDILPRFLKDVATSFDLHMLKESPKYYLNKCSTGETFLEHLERELYSYAKENSAILMGFGSQMIFAGYRDALHVRIIAPKDIRLARLKRLYHVSEDEAETALFTADKKHKKFVYSIFGVDLSDPSHYQMTLNTAALSVDECAASIIALMKEHDLHRKLEMQTENSQVIDNQTATPVFKNPAESEFARILDMYQIEWKYEPKTFPIEWDAEGNVTMAFSPDFYLPKFNTYLELTTMNQKYVTSKNKKLKKVQELYPGTNVKIIYKKDFYSLVERFGFIKGE